MSCEIQTWTQIAITDEERGYQEWSIGDDIHLVLSNEDYVFGEIMAIYENECELIIRTEGGLITIKFDEIEGYL